MTQSSILSDRNCKEILNSITDGFVIVDIDVRPEFDTGMMVKGFALNGVVTALIALLLHPARRPLRCIGIA